MGRFPHHLEKKETEEFILDIFEVRVRVYKK